MRARLGRLAVSSLLATSSLALLASAQPGNEMSPASELTGGLHSLVGSYLAGRMARSQNDTESAAGFYRSALVFDPGNELLLEQAFLMEASEGAGPRTLQLAEDLIAVDSQHRTARMMLGLRDFKAGSYKKAEQHFKVASTGPIGELTSAMAMAWIKLAEGKPADAFRFLEMPKQADWAQFYLRYHRALIADLAGRRQEARTAFERVFKQDPKALRTTLAYARHAARWGDLKLARSIIKEHLDKSQGDGHPLIRELSETINAGTKTELLVKSPAEGAAEVFYGLGEALIAEGAVPAGVLYMQMALSIEPEQQFALAALANAHEAGKRYADAIMVYDRIPKGSPLALPIEIRKAYNLNSLDRVDEARQTLAKLLDQTPATDAKTDAPAAAEPAKESSAFTQTATEPTLLKLGSKGDLVREVQQALQRQGFEIGEIDGAFGDSTRRAVQAFQKKQNIKVDGIAGPDTVAAILGSGRSTSGAEKPHDLTLTVNDQIQVLDALGSIQRSRKLYAEAVETYTRILALIPTPEPHHWTFFYARGTAYERVKNWPAAEVDLKKALELAPDQPLVMNYLGYSWVDQGINLKQGMALIEKAVAMKPDDGYIVDSLGWAHYMQGNFKEAVRYLERAVELKPDDPILNDHLGDALWKVGREREARFQWDQALSFSPEPEDVEKIKKKLAEGLDAASPVKKTTEAQPGEQPAPQAQ